VIAQDLYLHRPPAERGDARQQFLAVELAPLVGRKVDALEEAAQVIDVDLCRTRWSRSEACRVGS
jgi:hypothetical protein